MTYYSSIVSCLRVALAPVYLPGYNLSISTFGGHSQWLSLSEAVCLQNARI